MPDPIPAARPIPRPAAREALGVRSGPHLFVLAGALDRRKGTLELATSFARADLGDRAELLLVGPVDPTILDQLTAVFAGTSTISVIDRVVSDDEFWTALCAADTICAPYPQHVGSSGIQVRAAAIGTPMLSSSYGWVGEATRRYGLGIDVDCTDIGAIVDALHARIDSDITSTSSDTSAPYVASNTEDGFKEAWTAKIRQASPG